MNPAELRRKAADLAEQARAAFKRGDEAEAMRLVRVSWEVRDAADEREQLVKSGRLLRSVNKRTVNTMLSADHRVAISKGRAPAKNKLAVAAQDAGMSMRDLAKKIRVSVALLSMAATGERSLKREKAEQIERLTGYRVANWPDLA